MRGDKKGGPVLFFLFSLVFPFLFSLFFAPLPFSFVLSFSFLFSWLVCFVTPSSVRCCMTERSTGRVRHGNGEERQRQDASFGSTALVFIPRFSSFLLGLFFSLPSSSSSSSLFSKGKGRWVKRGPDREYRQRRARNTANPGRKVFCVITGALTITLVLLPRLPQRGRAVIIER